MATDAPPSGENTPPTAASPTSTAGETAAADANGQEEPSDAAKASQVVGGPQDGTAGAEADPQPPPAETEAGTAAESGEETAEDAPHVQRTSHARSSPSRRSCGSSFGVWRCRGGWGGGRGGGGDRKWRRWWDRCSQPVT